MDGGLSTTPTEPRFFASPSTFRAWLEEHHDSATELVVGFHKKGTGVPSITWPESVDQALCFGWIDGIRRSIDDSRYTVRFTPRKPASTWSVRNIARVAELTEAGLMHPAGVAAFERRSDERSGVYSFERAAAELGSAYERQFRAEPAAWAFFQAQPDSYRKTTTWWVISAKREETRQRRLMTLIEDSAGGRRIKQLARPTRAD